MMAVKLSVFMRVTRSKSRPVGEILAAFNLHAGYRQRVTCMRRKKALYRIAAKRQALWTIKIAAKKMYTP